MTPDQIIDFNKKKFGWISPTGDLIVTDLWKHFDSLRNIPEVSEKVNRYFEICDENDDFIHRELENLEPDEHPAMHRFEGINDDARMDLMIFLYENGWIRLGSHYRSNGIITKIEAEGFSDHIEKNKTIIKELAEIIGANAIFNSVEVVGKYQFRYFKSILKEK